MKSKPTKAKVGEGRKALPFFVRVAGEEVDFKRIGVQHMHRMSDAEWLAYRLELSRRSQVTRNGQVKSRAQNSILEANYYRALAKWKRGDKTKGPPQKPSAQRVPSEKQVYFLAALLGMAENKRQDGFHDFHGLVSYVEFANRLPRGLGFHPRLAPKGTALLNVLHWNVAITLAQKGRNIHGSEVQMILDDCGDVDQLTPELIDRGWVLAPRGRIVYEPVADHGGAGAVGRDGDVGDADELPAAQGKRAKATGSVDMGIRSMEELERAIGERGGD